MGTFFCCVRFLWKVERRGNLPAPGFGEGEGSLARATAAAQVAGDSHNQASRMAMVHGRRVEMLGARTRSTPGLQPNLLSEAHAAIPSEPQERFGVGRAWLWRAVHFRQRAVAKARFRILTTFEELREPQEQSERMRAHGLLRPAYARSQRAIPSNSPAFADSSSTVALESWMRKASNASLS